MERALVHSISGEICSRINHKDVSVSALQAFDLAEAEKSISNTPSLKFDSDKSRNYFYIPYNQKQGS